MGLQGKGFFIWKVKDAEGGNPTAIANAAKAAGYTHVMIKIADGSYSYNVDRQTNVDLVPPVVDALHQKGIEVWGWHYVYGNSPNGEADIAIRRLEELNLAGYIVDAEIEYKEPGKANAARAFMSRLRQRLPNLPVALSSYRFPSYHPQFPWQAFLEKCDLNMPQVYWEQAHNAGAQLRRCVREFQNLNPSLPVIPTGPAYTVGGWAPTNADIDEFIGACHSLGLPAANFFSWDECRARLPALWTHIASIAWQPPSAPEDISGQLIEALNSHNVDQVLSLYQPFAIHINSARSVQGSEAIRTWYSTLLTETLPNAAFQLTGLSGSGSSRHFTWQATSGRGSVINGNDTLGLLNEKIAYHYSYFTVTR